MQKKRDFLINFAFYLALAAIYYVGVKYLLPAVFPLLAAFATVYAADTVCTRIAKNRKMRKNALRVYLVLAALGGIVVCFAFGIKVCLPASQKMINDLPYFYKNTLMPAANKLLAAANRLFGKIPAVKDGLYSTVARSGISLVGSFGADIAAAFGRSLPNVMMQTAFYLVCCLLFAADFEKVKRAPFLFLSPSVRQTVKDILRRAADGMWGMAKAALQLAGTTFLLLWAGLWLIGIQRPLAVGALVAFCDLLPVLGCGAVLVPWGMIAFLQGNRYKAIALLCLWGVISAVRSILEPKLTGKQVGLHPALSLALAFFGLRLFGLWGVVVLPLTGVLAVGFLMP